MTDVARITRIEQLTAAAAVEFSQPVSADLVQLVGALRFAREEMLDRLATGARNPEQISAALIDNGAALDRLVPAVPPSVEVVIVSRAEVQKCPECAHEFAVQKVPQTLEEKQRLARLEHSRQSTPPATLDPAPSNSAATSPRSDCRSLEGKPKPKVDPGFDPARFVKDTRPDAPAPINGSGSLCWFGSNGAPKV
jgi:hypothetical protein